MKQLAVLALAAAAVVPAVAQTSVGVSVGIHQPGVYGRIDIGNVPPPAVVYPQPVIIQPAPVAVHRQPIYLYVPPGHQKNWGKFCGRYNACGQPVYFVQERWVRDRWEYERARRDRYEHGRPGRGHDDDRGRGHGRGH
jgi:hypothetical protein